MVSIKSVLMLSMLVMATLANPTPDDQTKINAAQTILTLTNSLVGIKNLLSGNKQHFLGYYHYQLNGYIYDLILKTGT